MKWFEEFRVKWASGTAHQFLLHLNTPDLLLREGQFRELNGFLVSQDPLQGAGFAATFTRAGGIKFIGTNGVKEFEKFLGKLYPQTVPGAPVPLAVANFRKNRHSVSYMLELFSDMLEIGWNDDEKDIQDVLKARFEESQMQEGRKKGMPFFAVIVDQVELLAPPAARESSTIDDRTALSAFLEWAKNEKVARAHNIVILVAEDLGRVADELVSDTRGIIPVEIPFLDFSGRLETSRALETQFPQAPLGIKPERLARISNGFSRRNLVQIMRETLFRGEALDEGAIFRKKQQHLKERVQDIASLYRSIWGMRAIGGMEHNTAYLMSVAQAMKRGDIFAVPQNIAFVGPKGTGKTVAAQAISYEADLDLLIIENPRNLFVGESERRLRFILKVAKSYVPIILFLDEFHLFVLRQGTFFSGDTGVTERIQKQFLEVMSDTDYRGRLLWIVATNHPEMVDDAFLRPGRIDDIRVFLPPSAEERAKIVPAILHKFQKQAEAAGLNFEHEIREEFFPELGELTHGHYKEEIGWLECDSETHRDKDTLRGFTGAEVEYVISHAKIRAEKLRRPLREEDLRWAVSDFMPTRNMREFNEATDAALRLCNSLEAIPPEWRDHARKIKGYSASDITNGQYL